MRRTALASAAAAIALGAAVIGFASPASASAGGTVFRDPSGPFDVAAGVECDFPIHAQPIVDQVYGVTTKTFPDGSPQQQIFAGPLVFRVTNTDNGKQYDANASGTALIDYGTDGSMVWHVIGPVLLNSKAGNSNLPRGVWVVGGAYSITFDTAGHKTVSATATEDNVCNHIA